MQKLPIKISLDDSFFEPEELCGHYAPFEGGRHQARVDSIPVH